MPGGVVARGVAAFFFPAAGPRAAAPGATVSGVGATSGKVLDEAGRRGKEAEARYVNVLL
jgi:hypothetical protein